MLTITLQPTKETGHINGVQVRVWTGASANGVPVRALIAFVGAEMGHDHAEFESELRPSEEPQMTAPTPIMKLDKAARPLMKHLATDYHPHHIAIVSSDRIKLVEGVMSSGPIEDFIID